MKASTITPVPRHSGQQNWRWQVSLMDGGNALRPMPAKTSAAPSQLGEIVAVEVHPPNSCENQRGSSSSVLSTGGNDIRSAGGNDDIDAACEAVPP